MNDYYSFGEILTHTNFLRSDLTFVKNASINANHSDTIIESKSLTSRNPTEKLTEYFCSNLEFDFEAMKWTDNKTGFEIITLEFIWKVATLKTEVGEIRELKS